MIRVLLSLVAFFGRPSTGQKVAAKALLLRRPAPAGQRLGCAITGMGA